MGAPSATDRSLVSTPITTTFPAAVSIPIAVPLGGPLENVLQAGGRARRRRISPQAGRALETLGHAIEYLSDEFVHSGGSLTARDGQVQAVQLLMGINRQIYFDCPVVPSFSERCRALLHLPMA